MLIGVLIRNPGNVLQLVSPSRAVSCESVLAKHEAEKLQREAARGIPPHVVVVSNIPLSCYADHRSVARRCRADDSAFARQTEDAQVF